VQQRQVKDLMRIRHGHVVPETATLREVAERLIISDCDVIAVVDGQRNLIGVVCESSVVRALMANPIESATIQSIVSRHAESIRLDATLNSVLPLFRSSGNTAIPVVDDIGCVCGLLMRRDVIGSLLHRRVDAPEATAAHSAAAPAGERTIFTKPKEIHGAVGQSDAHLPAMSKPHFLRAEDARRILWAAEDRL